MKTLKIFSTLPLFLAFAALSLPAGSFAQKAKANAIGSFNKNAKTEAIPVSGNCGMCKTKIEKTAKEAGASTAQWSADTKTLTVKYNSTSTNPGNIQQAIAKVGYDTRDFKATDESYNKLHACCQYDRTESVKMDCCKDGKCSKEGHDGKDCCKSADSKMDCCKDGKCSMPGHDGDGCCKSTDPGMDCCKDGKCSKPGHDGKDCCKKS